MVANKNEENQPMSEDETSAEIQAAGDDAFYDANTPDEDNTIDGACRYIEERLEDGGYSELFDDECLAYCASLYVENRKTFAAVEVCLRKQEDILVEQIRDWKSAVKTHVKDSKRKREEAEKARQREEDKRISDEIVHAGGVRFEDPIDDTQIALRLLEKLERKNSIPLCFDLGELWGYQPSAGLWESIWRKGYEGPLSRRVQAFEGSRIYYDDGKYSILTVSNSRTKSVIEVACNQRQANHWPTPFFDAAPRGITFADCFVRADLEARCVEKLELSPDHRARVGLPFDFDPKAETPLFDEYLREVFEPDEDVADKVALVWEMIGAGLLGFAANESLTGKMFMLHGDGGTGKSTLLLIIEALFPKDATSYITPQDFCDRDAGAQLEGMLLNVVHETPEANVLKEAGLKAIAHGQTIRRREVYKAGVTFAPRALHVFAANKLPSGPGLTGAFWDRWLVIEFNRRFRDTADVKPELHKDIIADELPGIAAKAIDAARRLLERNGGYTIPASSAARLEAWKGQDPVKQFFAEETSQVGIDRSNMLTWTPASEVWDAWNYWCVENGFSKMNRNTFDSRAEQAGYPIRKSGVRRQPCKIKVELSAKIEERQGISKYF